MSDCLDDIDSIDVNGYCVIYNGQSVHIPYTKKDNSEEHHQGRSFHHGKFIQNLRKAAKNNSNVTCIEGTVKNLQIENDKVTGVMLSNETRYSSYLTFVADGCFSNLRKQSLYNPNTSRTCGYFVGLILHDCNLPLKYHGNVILGDEHSCILLYQIGKHDTRILMDVRGKRPNMAGLNDHITDFILPYLPAQVQPSLLQALNDDEQRLRIMPNSYLRPRSKSNSKPGVVLIGDAHNQRHPLTGGGMTCALTDVNHLGNLLKNVDFSNDQQVQLALHNWTVKRRSTAGTINTLSMALYDLFSGDDPNLKVLKEGCFNYFKKGGDCIDGPVGLLSA